MAATMDILNKVGLEKTEEMEVIEEQIITEVTVDETIIVVTMEETTLAVTMEIATAEPTVEVTTVEATVEEATVGATGGEAIEEYLVDREERMETNSLHEGVSTDLFKNA